jgi:hypothetical protein
MVHHRIQHQDLDTRIQLKNAEALRKVPGARRLIPKRELIPKGLGDLKRVLVVELSGVDVMIAQNGDQERCADLTANLKAVIPRLV